MNPEEEPRGPGPSSAFSKDKVSTHNNKGQNCMECKLNDPPRGHVHGKKSHIDFLWSQESILCVLSGENLFQYEHFHEHLKWTTLHVRKRHCFVGVLGGGGPPYLEVPLGSKLLDKILFTLFL